MVDLARDVEAYAALAVELADPGVDRAAALALHGLDEEAWEALDDAWQTTLSDAMEEERDGVPAQVLTHAEAFARAQRSRAVGALPFERFVETARALRGGGDVGATLRRLGVCLDAFLRAQAHWTAEMIADEELAERFRDALR